MPAATNAEELCVKLLEIPGQHDIRFDVSEHSPRWHGRVLLSVRSAEGWVEGGKAEAKGDKLQDVAQALLDSINEQFEPGGKPWNGNPLLKRKEVKNA